MNRHKLPSRANIPSGGNEAPSDDENDQSVGQAQVVIDDTEIQPECDSAKRTRTQCIIAIVFGVVAALFSLIYGIFILSTKQTAPSSALSTAKSEMGLNNDMFLLGAYIRMDNVSQELSAFTVNIILTFCIDSMMFAHSVSLRWALYHEQRLEYNTNLRLFTSSKISGPNRWYSNVSLAFCLVLCYASTSILFVPAHDPGEEGNLLLVNATALITLGIGLAGQAIIAAWSMTSGWDSIPSWGSNPINTALAAVNMGSFTRRTGRCMLSVHQRHEESGRPVYPKKFQRSIMKAQRTIRYILTFLWVLVILAISWVITIVIVANRGSYIHVDDRYVACWDIGFQLEYDVKQCSSNSVSVALTPTTIAAESRFVAEAVLSILFLCGVQASQTIGLHCVELVINISRDEALWRQAHNSTGKRDAKGAVFSENPLRAAITSPQNIVLFVAKAGLHWIIGQGMHPYISDDFGGLYFSMIYSRLIVYAILVLLLVVFTTYIALRQPKGCQPATLGHLQTLVDLVDDWGMGKSGRIWWGGKNLSTNHGGIRHAGTSSNKALLSPICMSAEYQ